MQASRRPAAAKSRAKLLLVLPHLPRAGAAGMTEVKISCATRPFGIGRRVRLACAESVNQPRKLSKCRALKQSETMPRNELEISACQGGTIARGSLASSPRHPERLPEIVRPSRVAGGLVWTSSSLGVRRRLPTVLLSGQPTTHPWFSPEVKLALMALRVGSDAKTSVN
jgi:hypothetical protein